MWDPSLIHVWLLILVYQCQDELKPAAGLTVDLSYREEGLQILRDSLLNRRIREMDGLDVGVEELHSSYAVGRILASSLMLKRWLSQII